MQTKNINISVAVSKAYGKYGTSNLCYLAIAELEMFGDVVVEQAGVTNVIKGQTLETISGVCDGRTVEAIRNLYTRKCYCPPANYSKNAVGKWCAHDIVTGSSINYKPPSGTKQLIYKFTLAVSGDSAAGGANALAQMASLNYLLIMILK